LDKKAISTISISNTGEKNWEINLDKNEYLLFSNGISLTEDETIIIGTMGNLNKVPHRLFAISSSGKIVWQVEIKASIIFSPKTSKDGTIFFVTDEPALYSLDKEGHIKWVYRDDIEGEICCNPIISKDGLIYVLCNSGSLYIFDQNGNMVNTLELEKAELYDSPYFDLEGTLYLPPNITAFDSEYKVKWVYTPSEGFIPSNLFFADDNNNLYCYANYFRLISIDKNGVLRWETKMRGNAIDFPPIAGGGNCICTCSIDKAKGKNDSYIQAFNEEGKLMWELCINNESLVGIVPGNMNSLFALTNDVKGGKCKIYCFSMLE